MRRSALLLCMLFVCLFAYAQPSGKYTDSKGMSIPLQEVHRIVSLGPGVTETICALGAMDKLVGRTDYCDYPKEVLSVPSIGEIINPSIERIIRLRPDMVIAGSMVNQNVYDALAKAGITIVCINKEQSFEGTYGFIRDIGKVIGKAYEAEQLVRSMQDEMNAIKERWQNEPKKRVYLAISFGMYDSTATGDTFLDKMITIAGGINVAEDGRNWMYSKEKLVTDNPEVIILMSRMSSGESDDQLLKQWNSTKPYSDLKAKIRIIDGDLIGRQGPRIVDAVKEIALLIHGA